MSHATLATERLILRPLAERDVGAIVAGIGDLEVSRWLTVVPHPYGPEDAEAFLALVAEKDLPARAIDAGEGLIGVIEAGEHLGYWLGRAHWGRGYGFEAARAAVDAAFVAGLDAMRSGYFPANAGSARIQEKLGFVPTGVERAHCAALGEDVDLQRTRLTRALWEARHGD